MTFDEMYKDKKYLDQIDFEGSFLIKGKEFLPCWNCDKDTQWMDGCFGACLCSPECERMKWEEYRKALHDGPHWIGKKGNG